MAKILSMGFFSRLIMDRKKNELKVMLDFLEGFDAILSDCWLVGFTCSAAGFCISVLYVTGSKIRHF